MNEGFTNHINYIYFDKKTGENHDDESHDIPIDIDLNSYQKVLARRVRFNEHISHGIKLGHRVKLIVSELVGKGGNMYYCFYARDIISNKEDKLRWKEDSGYENEGVISIDYQFLTKIPKSLYTICVIKYIIKSDNHF